MPQEFQALQCYNCKIFQVEIVKKTLKWICKICHEKQSVKQVFMKGTSKDCRLFIQNSNEIFAASVENIPAANAHIPIRFSTATDVDGQADNHDCVNENLPSKWEQFVTADEAAKQDDENITNDNYTFVRHRKRKRGNKILNTERMKGDGPNPTIAVDDPINSSSLLNIEEVPNKTHLHLVGEISDLNGQNYKEVSLGSNLLAEHDGENSYSHEQILLFSNDISFHQSHTPSKDIPNAPLVLKEQNHNSSESRMQDIYSDSSASELREIRKKNVFEEIPSEEYIDSICDF